MIDTMMDRHANPAVCGSDGAVLFADYLAPDQRPRSALPVPRVLHVDADLDTALMVATLLMPQSQLTHVHTLQAALRALGEQPYSLVVLDPELADGDGGAVFEALRRSGATTPVLLYVERHTAWSDQASAVLFKPWSSPRQLWDAASRLLRPLPAAGCRP